MNEPLVCATCGTTIDAEPCAACAAIREAAKVGAQPPGVPLRVYNAYLEARAALRANDGASATRVLQWLVAHLAEARGAHADQSLAAKLEQLRETGALSPRMQPELVTRALTPTSGPEQAWALMSIVESAFYRLYLRPTTSAS